MAKEYAPFVRKIEIEVETMEQVKEAVEAGADIIMLDNMTPEMMKEAVELIARPGTDRMLRKYHKGKYRQNPGNRCGFCFQRCTDTFCSNP